jgi:Ca2+-binding EF-hand superfamily protein
VSFAVLLFFTASFAQARSEMAGHAATERFTAMDKDKSGSVSREEFFAAHPNMREAAFAAIDTDKDGVISLDEWQAFFKGHGKDGDQAHSHGPDEKDKGRIPDLIMPPAKR